MDFNVIRFEWFNPRTSINLNDCHIVILKCDSRKSVDRCSNESEEIRLIRFHGNTGVRAVQIAGSIITQGIQECLIANGIIVSVYEDFLLSDNQEKRATFAPPMKDPVIACDTRSASFLLNKSWIKTTRSSSYGIGVFVSDLLCPFSWTIIAPWTVKAENPTCEWYQLILARSHAGITKYRRDHRQT